MTTLRDIAREQQHAQVVGLGVRQRQLQRELAPVLAHARHLAAQAAGRRVIRLASDHRQHVRSVLGEQVGCGKPHEFAALAAEHARRGGVGALHPPLRVEDKDAVHRRLEDGALPGRFRPAGQDEIVPGLGVTADQIDRRRHPDGKTDQQDHDDLLGVPGAAAIPIEVGLDPMVVVAADLIDRRADPRHLPATPPIGEHRHRLVRPPFPAQGDGLVHLAELEPDQARDAVELRPLHREGGALLFESGELHRDLGPVAPVPREKALVAGEEIAALVGLGLIHVREELAEFEAARVALDHLLAQRSRVTDLGHHPIGDKGHDRSEEERGPNEGARPPGLPPPALDDHPPSTALTRSAWSIGLVRLASAPICLAKSR